MKTKKDINKLVEVIYNDENGNEQHTFCNNINDGGWGIYLNNIKRGYERQMMYIPDSRVIDIINH